MKKCPIVKIALPFKYGLHSKMFYCDEHSLTAEIYPMNEYQIQRLEEEALLGLKHKGCIIPPEIRELEFYNWLQNKDKYLSHVDLDIYFPYGEEKNAMQRYVGVNPNSTVRNRENSFNQLKSCYAFALHCNE